MDDTLNEYVKSDLAQLIRAAQDKCATHLRRRQSTNRTNNDGTATVDGCQSGDAVAQSVVAMATSSSSSSFTYSDLVKIQAPMVRCSRPPFRKLCRLWGTDISYTHMIMAESFTKSAAARASDFALYQGEDRLIVQLAGTSAATMAGAVQYLAPYCDAVDINCGCPQKWAMREGIGAAMLEKPQLVADMVAAIRNAVPGELMPCVVKMRVYDDEARSVDFSRQVEAAGASWVTVHGRSPWDTPSAPVRTHTIALIRESLTVPVVANGSVETPRSAMGLALSTGVGAVMSARGILSNPAMFEVGSGSCRSGEASVVLPSLPASRNGNDDLGVATDSSTPLSSWPARSLVACSGAADVLASHPDVATLPHDPLCPKSVIGDFLRLSAACDLPVKATQHHVLLMAHHYLSPLERSFIAQQRSAVGVTLAMQRLGFLGEGDEGGRTMGDGGRRARILPLSL